MKVCGLGQCSLDFIALVDGYPEEDAKHEARELSIQGGGPVATALVALSRLGAKASFIGRVSDDRAGREIIEGLREEGVDTAGVRVKKGGTSQTAFITVNLKNGSRTICWKRPTVAELGPRDVPAAIIKDSQFLLLDGLMMEASLKAARIARKHDVPVMLDAGRKRPGMMELASLSDYIVASSRFACDIAPTPREAIKKLKALGKRPPVAVTVTLGAKGSITWSGGKVFSTPAFRVKTVDTTGAGDVFHGAYAFGILKGWSLKDTVRFASAAAALKCLKPGGRAGIPTLAGALRFLKSLSFVNQSN